MWISAWTDLASAYLFKASLCFLASWEGRDFFLEAGGRPRGGLRMTGRRMGPDVLPWQAESWPGPHSGRRNRLRFRNLYTSGRTSGPILPGISKSRGGRDPQGSLTVETALVLPLLICFFLGFLCFFLFFRFYQDVGQALADTGREIGQSVYDSDGDNLAARGLGLWTARQNIETRSRDKAALAFVEGGTSGISLAKSRIFEKDARIELVAEYKIRLPWLLLGMKPIPVIQRQACRAWVGYTGETGKGEKEPYVYITPYGTVYHQRPDCKYLNPSIQPLLKGEQETTHNKDGERYYACESCCGHGTGGILYVTDYGNRYHQSLSCPGLKRSVYLVPLSEAAGRGACGGCS